MTAQTRYEDDDTAAYWDGLYEDGFAQLYRTVAFLLPAADAEEVVHDAFERALRVRDFRATVHEPHAWLRTVAARLAYDRLRRRRVWERSRMFLVGAPAPSHEIATEIRDALRGLAPRARVALVLRYYQDAPYKEIADALGLTEESVGPLLTRAKQDLREALE